MIGLDTFLSIGTNVMNNAWEDSRTEHARSQNYTYNEKSAQNAFYRQKQLLNEYYTPEAQLKHLTAAGLSPSVMYQGSGTTGTTSAPQGQGASGLKPDFIPLDLKSLTELQLMKAETKNAQAQANEHQAEADRLNGESKYGQTEIEKMLSEAGLNNAQKTYTKAQTDLAEIEKEIKEATKQEQIDEITWKAKSAEREYQYVVNKVRMSELEWNFANETYDARVNEVKEKTRNLFHDTQLKWAQTQLTEAQELEVYNVINKIVEEISQKWQELAQDKDLRQKEIDFNYHKLEQELAKAWKEMKLNTTIESERMIVNMISAMIGAAIVGSARNKK